MVKMGGIRASSLQLILLVLFSMAYEGNGGSAIGPTSSSHSNSASGVKFVTQLSTLWRGSEELRFRTKYASGTTVEGFICSDYIEVGGFGSLAPFGCITKVEGIIDGQGIAGFAPSGAGDRKGFKLPPVFKALANVSGNHGTMGLPVPRPSFSFLCDEKGGELQLGGYDPDAVIGFPTQVASLSQSSYMVPVTGMWIGNTGVLEFSKPRERGFVGGILDSGATCVCLPDNLMGGKLSKSPWQALTSIAKGSPSHPLTVEINSTIKIDIPASVWLESVQSVRGCPAKKCPDDDIVLGDWFFRAALVNIDWFTNNQKPGIRIGYRNYSYALKRSKASTGSMTSVPMTKKYPPRPPETTNSAPSKGIKRMALSDPDRVALLIAVDIGWPPQRFDLVFDTGSSFFGVMTVPTRRVLLGKKEASHEAALARMHKRRAKPLFLPASKSSEFDSTVPMIALAIAMVTSVIVSVWVRRRRRRVY